MKLAFLTGFHPIDDMINGPENRIDDDTEDNYGEPIAAADLIARNENGL